MTKKRKHKKQEQAEVAEAATQQQQRQKLKRQISLMKRLPKDFRDITLGTEWEAFADITDRRKEMNDWWNGPIVYFGELNKHEKMILGSPNKLIKITNYNFLGSSNWVDVLVTAESLKASWIYLPDEELPVITALNKLFSRFGFNIRAKGQLISEHTGHPVGVVH